MENSSYSYLEVKNEMLFVISNLVYKGSMVKEKHVMDKKVVTKMNLWEGERGIGITKTNNVDQDPFYSAAGFGVVDDNIVRFAIDWIDKIKRVVQPGLMDEQVDEEEPVDKQVEEQVEFGIDGVREVFEMLTKLFPMAL